MYQLEEHIFLIGFMGVGKSTIARILSKMLGVREYDTDRMIVAREGREISKIFEEDGELAFRKMETDLLEDLKGYKPSIIACGGGVAMRTENVESMKRQGLLDQLILHHMYTEQVHLKLYLLHLIDLVFRSLTLSYFCQYHLINLYQQ